MPWSKGPVCASVSFSATWTVVLLAPWECMYTLHRLSTVWLAALVLLTAPDTISGSLGAQPLAPAWFPHNQDDYPPFHLIWASLPASEPSKGRLLQTQIGASSDHPGRVPDRGQYQRVGSLSAHCEWWCPRNMQCRGSGASHALQTTRACGRLRDPAGTEGEVPMQ